MVSVGRKGNIVSFLVEKEGISKEEAIAKVNGFYSLVIYANEINIDISFLESLGVANGTNAVKIPYYDEEKQEIAIRYKMKNFKYRWEKGSKANLYGLWKLKEFEDKSYIILVKRRRKRSCIMV